MTPVYDKLSIADQRSICYALKLPLPTPDITLDMIIAQEKIQPADILVRLERSRDMRAMIAAAVIRGKLKACPPDAQLHPKPYPKAPVARPKGELEANRKTEAKPKAHNRTRVLLTVKPNPKRPGSAARDRYSLYKLGLTEAQLLELGLWRSDFRHDTQHQFITWSE